MLDHNPRIKHQVSRDELSLYNHLQSKIHGTYAVHPFGITKTRFACGSMVLSNHMFVFFALYERKKDKREKRKNRSAEGKEAPTA
jgi:hypothetical protein